MGERVARALERLGTPAAILARHGVQVQHRMAVCPFHADEDPSLSLFTGRDGRGRFRCHGCGVTGDALDLEAMLSGRQVGDLIQEFNQ